MSVIRQLLLQKSKPCLNVYFTAGFPNLVDTVPILQSLQSAGVDLIELGIPYADPLADGTTIQQSSSKALANGMNLTILFDQVSKARSQGVHIPIIAMGYYNQMLQFGPERFLQNCKKAGINGLIIPDLPFYIYNKEYEALFSKYELGISFLITPDTSEERVRSADQYSTDFIYMVSQSSITGGQGTIDDVKQKYFERIHLMGLESPRLIGFGIHNADTFAQASKFAHGCIVGSAFIRHLDQFGSGKEGIESFVHGIISHR